MLLFMADEIVILYSKWELYTRNKCIYNSLGKAEDVNNSSGNLLHSEKKTKNRKQFRLVHFAL